MRIRSLAYWILAWLLGNPILLSGQWRGPQLARLGPEDGIPAEIIDMAQDSTGYLYLGTNVGLYRYDGHSFDFFGHDPMNESSIGAGVVYRVYPARNDLIWLALGFGGLNSFNPKTGQFKRYPLPELSFRSVPGATSIYEDDDGALWVGATHFRLMIFDRKSETYTVFTPDWIDPMKEGGRFNILSIAADRSNPNLLWLSVLDYSADKMRGRTNGIVSFNKSTKEFQGYSCVGQTKVVDKEGVMWGTYWGEVISKFNPATGECELFRYLNGIKDQTIRGISHDIEPYGDHLIVATTLALLEFDKKGIFEVVTTIASNEPALRSLFTDRDENIWIGATQGAFIVDPDDQHIRFFSLEKFGTTDRLYPGRLAYYAPDDVVYLTHTSDDRSMRIYQIPLSEDQKEEATFISTNFQVHGIACDHHHRVWIGADGDFHRLDTETSQITRTNLIGPRDEPLPWIQNMKSNGDGWVGALGHDEFIWFHGDTQRVKRIRMDQLPGSDYAKSFDNYFDGFFLGAQNKAYLFSNEIFIVDLITGIPTVLKYDQHINPNYQHVQYVGEDDGGDIWVSTVELAARFHLEEDSLVLQDVFTLQDGMISPTAVELHMDNNGRVWAFTTSGINCIDPVTREVRSFSTKEGLPNPFNDPRQVIDVSEGRIATVCANGMIVFDADVLWNSVAPSNEPVVIKQIRLGGEQLVSAISVNTIAHLDLSPDQTLVDIEFQGLAYPTDYGMEYSYRVTGLHENWISIGQNKFVTLPALGPGEYTFEVKVGRPGSESPVKKLEIHVSTPLYMRTWFLIFTGICLAALFYAFIQWRIRRIRRQESTRTEINKKFAELELKALRSQMNPHFMFNSLNSIKNYILQAKPELAAEYLSNFAHLIRMILQNSREKTITLQEELETLILYIELEKLRFDEEFEFSCTIDDALQLDHIKIPPMLLQPYVENAIWHGLMHKKEPGHLLLQFSKEANMVACMIEDDGLGRENARKMKSLSAVRYKSMGMGINEDRIEIMNKMDALGIVTEVIDKYDADGHPSGTRVVVRIPGANGAPIYH